jgi:CheY-like chemotaxis protein
MRSVVPAAAAAGPRTALVVEDDANSAELIRLQLEAEGFTVLHVASAEDALALAAQQPLSLITLDILLPGMDGWELLTRIKSVPALSRIPVVIISIVPDHDRGLALGAAAVVQKPISRQALYASLLDLGLFAPDATRTGEALSVGGSPAADVGTPPGGVR